MITPNKLVRSYVAVSNSVHYNCIQMIKNKYNKCYNVFVTAVPCISK